MRPLSGEVATVGVAPGQGELHVTGQSMERRERRGQHARQREAAGDSVRQRETAGSQGRRKRPIGGQVADLRVERLHDLQCQPGGGEGRVRSPDDADVQWAAPSLATGLEQILTEPLRPRISEDGLGGEEFPCVGWVGPGLQ